MRRLCYPKTEILKMETCFFLFRFLVFVVCFCFFVFVFFGFVGFVLFSFWF